jgi:hypothetical protein
VFTTYPFNLPGQIYGSPMPFGLYDPGGKLLHNLKTANISAIVLLADIEECREKTGRDLVSLYRDQGLTVFPLPTPNYGVPSNGQLADVLKQTSARASYPPAHTSDTTSTSRAPNPPTFNFAICRSSSSSIGGCKHRFRDALCWHGRVLWGVLAFQLRRNRIEQLLEIERFLQGGVGSQVHRGVEIVPLT